MPATGSRRTLLGTAALTLALSALLFTETAYAAKPVGSGKGANTEQSSGGNGKGHLRRRPWPLIRSTGCGRRHRKRDVC